jgi:hypothetical protein
MTLHLQFRFTRAKSYCFPHVMECLNEQAQYHLYRKKVAVNSDGRDEALRASYRGAELIEKSEGPLSILTKAKGASLSPGSRGPHVDRL